MVKRTVVFLIALCIVGGVGFIAYAWHPSIAPITQPAASSFPAEAVRRGALVAASGYCAECHTRQDGKGGPALAGDFRMDTPFGTLYSSNITPDPQTGIGRWSEKAFRRAMQNGVSRDGHLLYPAFPYDHFTKMSDRDIADLYAWLMSQPAVSLHPRKNTLVFPFNIRLLQGGWRLLFFSPGRYKEDPHHDEIWNRGAYLAEGAGHCGACHTSRNMLGAERTGHAYDGAVVDGWIAPPLNAHNPTPTAWTEEELFHYLRDGAALLHGSVAGPMAPVVHAYLAQLPDSDIRALAHYFADRAKADHRRTENEAALNQAMQASGRDMSGPFNGDADARLYQTSCGACHFNSGAAPLPGRPELGLSSALWLKEPTNLFQVMLRGVSAHEGQKGLVMPSFYQALSAHDMARIAAYLRRTRTTLPPWTNLEKKAAQARAAIKTPPINGAH